MEVQCCNNVPTIKQNNTTRSVIVNFVRLESLGNAKGWERKKARGRQLKLKIKVEVTKIMQKPLIDCTRKPQHLLRKWVRTISREALRPLSPPSLQIATLLDSNYSLQFHFRGLNTFNILPKYRFTNLGLSLLQSFGFKNSRWPRIIPQKNLTVQGRFEGFHKLLLIKFFYWTQSESFYKEILFSRELLNIFQIQDQNVKSHYFIIKIWILHHNIGRNMIKWKLVWEKHSNNVRSDRSTEI